VHDLLIVFQGGLTNAMFQKELSFISSKGGRAYVSCKKFSTSIFALKTFCNASLELRFVVIVDDDCIITISTNASIIAKTSCLVRRSFLSLYKTCTNSLESSTITVFGGSAWGLYFV